MTESRTKLESLVRQSRQEPEPSIDIVDKVVDRIMASTVPTAADWTLWGAVGLSVAAAAVVLVVALQQDVFLEDPLASWIRPLVVVMK